VCVVCRETMKSEDEFYAHCQQHHAAAITAAAVAASSSSSSAAVTPSSIPCIVCRQTLVSALELTLHARHHYRSNHHHHSQQQQQQQQAACCVCSTTDGVLSPLCTTSNSLYYICLACERRDGLSVVTSASPSSKTFQCIKCQQSFCTEEQVRVHVVSHVLQDGSVHRCLLCDTHVAFDTPARLQAHIVTEHEFARVTDAVCDICALTMSGPVAARQHALEHAPTAWKHACPRCSLRFFFAAELRNHQLVEGHDRSPSPAHQSASGQQSSSAHVDDHLQLRCTDCSRTFSGYASLCSHRRVHEKNTLRPSTTSVSVPLDCTSSQRERSGSAPSQCVTVTVDRRSESSGTSLQCPECSRQFPSLSSLQGHMRVHSSGEIRSTHKHCLIALVNVVMPISATAVSLLTVATTEIL